MRDVRYKRGFTLVELLLALIVTGIILAAVTTLAFAVGAANDTTDDTSQKQSQVRYATLRISELIRHCKLICGTPSGEIAIWRADNNGDGQININELVYIERGAGGDYLRLCEFPSSDTTPVELSDISTLSTSDYIVTYVPLVPQCSNVEFGFLPELPPQSRFVSISFDVVENDIVRQYQISAALRGWAGNLLNGSGDNIVSDDD
ncbi:MAG: prepilin-type N-terminal cleavage/methylation domain-containing protein [Planctomycetes bacterium]|nr:prepilin-type N-terminal cleavage/methylation domain-containing protein [Planctomycetota bacterium]